MQEFLQQWNNYYYWIDHKVKYTQKLIKQFLFLLAISGKIIVSRQMICGYNALDIVNITK